MEPRLWSEDDAAAYQALDETQAWLPIDSLALVELAGPDVRDWLQGQMAQDVGRLRPERAIGAVFLKPTGQTEILATLFERGDRIGVLLPTESVADFERRLETTVFLEDVRAERKDSTPRLLAGPQAAAALERLSWSSERRALAAQWGNAWLVWTESAAEEARLNEASWTHATDQAAQTFLLESEVPRWGADATPKTLPAELGTAFLAEWVSLTKGCYVGQEIVMRLHSRGHTNRTWRFLRCEAAVEPGSEVRDPAGQVVGEITRTGYSPIYGPIAGARLRNEVELGARGLKIGPEGILAQVTPFPRRTASVSP